jgi:hypothetical protein
VAADAEAAHVVEEQQVAADAEAARVVQEQQVAADAEAARVVQEQQVAADAEAARVAEVRGWHFVTKLLRVGHSLLVAACIWLILGVLQSYGHSLSPYYRIYTLLGMSNSDYESFEQCVRYSIENGAIGFGQQ